MQPAQRTAHLPGAAPLAAVLAVMAAAISGCTTEGTPPSVQDGKAASPGQSVTAEPGKYRTLPEACGAVDRKTLHDLLPVAESQDEDSADAIYAGQPTVTFDTDRRVGCRWKLETPAGSRHLTLDFQRVVSYDPAVSDDDRALERYAKKAVAAHVPGASELRPSTESSGPPASPTGTPDEPGKHGQGSGAEESAIPDGNGKGPNGDQGGTPSEGPGTDPADPSGTPDTDSGTYDITAPRSLDDLADNGFLDDRLVTTDSGVHRDITVVFRSSNVIVTIEYDQWSSDKTHIPPSEQLQVNAEDLAQELTGAIDE
ncbi:DUF3558 domain-containing protein [Streptomyces palmae]|uniref:DUF3558 domain-containing protein n=1 Tax=Streptomyces palmae TaxID=1701085 RepID=A0A4Z0HD39_9ACTN|nr:DUF3558 domain-containing protein [Streptomyces palmae]TGB15300.1 DUF3558 domain-containing protein [Streptomyces palmae]